MTATDSPRRTALVTGAAGFIGSALCRHLLAAGHRVVGYDDLSRGRREFLPDGVRLVEGDIRDGGRLRATVAEAAPDWVVHLAAMHFIPDCIARPRETMEVNVEGTRRVLDGCRGGAVRQVIVASSAAVYAPGDDACIEDSTPLGPLEVYGESKVATEELARAFHQESGISTTILRLFNAIGRNETNPHVVPHIFESLQRSDAVRLGNIAPRRDYIDTRDVAEAIAAVAERAHGLGVFNVGTGRGYSVSDLLERLRRILGRPIVVVQETVRLRANERMTLLADIGRIRRDIGWTPRVPLDESLRDLAAAYGLQAQPHAAP